MLNFKFSNLLTEIPKVFSVTPGLRSQNDNCLCHFSYLVTLYSILSIEKSAITTYGTIFYLCSTQNFLLRFMDLHVRNFRILYNRIFKYTTVTYLALKSNIN